MAPSSVPGRLPPQMAQYGGGRSPGYNPRSPIFPGSPVASYAPTGMPGMPPTPEQLFKIKQRAYDPEDPNNRYTMKVLINTAQGDPVASMREATKAMHQQQIEEQRARAAAMDDEGGSGCCVIA